MGFGKREKQNENLGKKYRKFFPDQEREFTNEELAAFVELDDLLGDDGSGEADRNDLIAPYYQAVVNYHEGRLDKYFDGEYLVRTNEPKMIAKEAIAITCKEDEFDNLKRQRYAEKGFDENEIKEEKIEKVRSELKDVEIKWLSKELQEANDRLEASIEEASRDFVTGLMNRNRFYKRAHGEIDKTFKDTQDGKIPGTDQELLEAIVASGDELKDVDLFVMQGDIAYLGLVNSLVGHEKGDELLRMVSREVNKAMGMIYKTGGDEFMGIYRISKEKLAEMIIAAVEVVNKMEIADLKKYSLDPNIDMGVTRFSDAVALYKELLADGESAPLFRKDVRRNLMNIWTRLADKKMYKNKAKLRIQLLMDRVKNDRENSGSITKGAYDITVEELEAFMAMREQGQDIDAPILDFITMKEMEIYKKTSEATDKIILRNILKKVGLWKETLST